MVSMSSVSESRCDGAMCIISPCSNMIEPPVEKKAEQKPDKTVRVKVY